MANTDFTIKQGEDLYILLDTFILNGVSVTDLSGYGFIFALKVLKTDTDASAIIKKDTTNDAIDFTRDNIEGELQIHAIYNTDYTTIPPKTYFYEVWAVNTASGESYLSAEGRIKVNDAVLDVVTI